MRIKTCPFCGSEPEFKERNLCLLGCETNDKEHFVKCSNGKCIIGFTWLGAYGSKEGARVDWDKRIEDK